MKKQKKVKKLTLDKETLARLQHVVGGGLILGNQVASGGPDICWFSDCNACDSDLGC
jgi:hypothetical protein